MDLYERSLLAIFLVGLAMILAASETGHRFGRRTLARSGDDISTLKSATLGLPALIIAFTFSMALSRSKARRDAVLSEANAIGTTAFRARLLPEPHRTESLKLLREYVKVRLDIPTHPMSRAELGAAVDRSDLLQEALWQQAKAMAAKDSGMVPTGLFIQTLNEMIDNQAKRLAAIGNRAPNTVLLLLFGLAAIAGGFWVYASGLDERRNRLPIFIVGLVVSIVILLILDLDRPSSGFIKVSHEPMIDTAASLATFSD